MDNIALDHIFLCFNKMVYFLPFHISLIRIDPHQEPIEQCKWFYLIDYNS
jgi:hypothetical protein